MAPVFHADLERALQHFLRKFFGRTWTLSLFLKKTTTKNKLDSHCIKYVVKRTIYFQIDQKQPILSPSPFLNVAWLGVRPSVLTFSNIE